MATKLPVTASKELRGLGRPLPGLLFNYFGSDTSGHTRTTECVKSESRSLTIVSSIYLALKTNSGQPKTLLCI